MSTKLKIRVLAVMVGVIALAVPLMVNAQELTDVKQDADTSVSGEVTSDISKPSYVISIPKAIDFGTLRKPSENINAYKDIPFEVRMESISDLQEGQVVAVLAKDGGWVGTDRQATPFAITGNTQKLEYGVYAGSTSADAASAIKLFEDGRWYANGFLYGTFGRGTAGQGIQGVLRLNQKQLYNKDSDAYKGSYSGTLKFHTAIVSAADY